MDWVAAGDYSIAHLVVARGVALVYLIAFAVAHNQFPALLGDNGLLPVTRYVEIVPFRHAPSLFHRHYSDRMLRAIAWTGMVVSAIALVGLLDAVPTWAWMVGWLLLWVLYESIVNVGQIFYGFGWESLLLEVGFLVAFLGPHSAGTSWPILIAFRWVLFRLEFGAGLIKMRGDRCWRDLTCLYYHHETQPMPNALSAYFHHLPKAAHKIEVAANHFAQLVVPFALFAPQPVASMAGGIVVVTQSWLLLSGNFSWLNTITIVLGFSAIDDRTFAALLPIDAPSPEPSVATWHAVVTLVLATAIAVMSYWPLRNMLGRAQAMNASFNPLHLVNTYGAFGSVTRTRYEIVVEATIDEVVTPDTEWRPYEFKGKPTDLHRRPPQIAPYHLRLDWLMWFVAISPSYAGRWFTTFLKQLLENDAATLRLLRAAPFDEAPTFVRARRYVYRFTTRRERRAGHGWWHRELVGDLVPPISLHGGIGGVSR
ncbi:MAG TPA: lipase maturation factor family protein [Actinomycetota bacterium]|nr:lipase maturation factor family protein [Actinomycetota bacterium]